MKVLAHGHRGHRASSAPKGHSIVAQGNALGLMAPPHRFPSPVGATLGFVWPIWGSTCRSWYAPSGLCGSLGDRFPGRCPGLRWAAPLVLGMGRLMGAALVIGALMRLGLMTRRPGGRAFRRGPRPVPNGAEQRFFGDPKTTTHQPMPTGRRHSATTGDRNWACEWGGRRDLAEMDSVDVFRGSVGTTNCEATSGEQVSRCGEFDPCPSADGIGVARHERL